MARLSAARRKKIPTSKFVFKGSRKYPIDTPGRARSALRLVGMHGTSSQKAKVRAAVRRKYPSIGRASKGRKRR